MVRAEWPLLPHGVPTSQMDDLSLKPRLLKKKVKVWTQENSMEMKEKIILIEEEIKNLLESSSSGLLNSLENNRLFALREELHQLMDHELRSAMLQSRMTWASLGDANTKLFHSVASTRRNHNSIWGL